MQWYLSLCMSICVSTRLSCLFAGLSFFVFHVLGKNDWTLPRSVHMVKWKQCFLWGCCIIANPQVYSMQWHEVVWIVHSNISPFRNVLCVFWWLRRAVLCIMPGSSKSLCTYFSFFLFFFKWVPPNFIPQNQPAFLTSWEVCFGDGRWDQMRFHVGCIYTFRGLTFLFTDFFSFLLWWQLCIPK